MLYDITHMISMADLVAISIETQMITSGCSLEKEFTEFITQSYFSIKLIHAPIMYVSFDLRNQRSLYE